MIYTTNLLKYIRFLKISVLYLNICKSYLSDCVSRAERLLSLFRRLELQSLLAEKINICSLSFIQTYLHRCPHENDR